MNLNRNPRTYGFHTQDGKATPSGYKIDTETYHLGIGLEAMMDNLNFEGMTEEILALCKLINEESVNENYSKNIS